MLRYARYIAIILLIFTNTIQTKPARGGRSTAYHPAWSGTSQSVLDSSSSSSTHSSRASFTSDTLSAPAQQSIAIAHDTAHHVKIEPPVSYHQALIDCWSKYNNHTHQSLTAKHNATRSSTQETIMGWPVGSTQKASTAKLDGEAMPIQETLFGQPLRYVYKYEVTGAKLDGEKILGWPIHNKIKGKTTNREPESAREIGQFHFDIITSIIHGANIGTGVFAAGEAASIVTPAITAIATVFPPAAVTTGAVVAVATTVKYGPSVVFNVVKTGISDFWYGPNKNSRFYKYQKELVAEQEAFIKKNPDALYVTRVEQLNGTLFEVTYLISSIYQCDSLHQVIINPINQSKYGKFPPVGEIVAFSKNRPLISGFDNPSAFKQAEAAALAQAKAPCHPGNVEKPDPGCRLPIHKDEKPNQGCGNLDPKLPTQHILPIADPTSPTTGCGDKAPQPAKTGCELATNSAAVKADNKKIQNDTSKKDETGKSDKTISDRQSPKREVVLDKVDTYEQARNKALEIMGDVDWHSGKPYAGRLGIGKSKIVGRSWHGEKVILRLDWDHIKGPHINFTDYRDGKGIKGTVISIPFNGTEATVGTLLKHLQ